MVEKELARVVDLKYDDRDELVMHLFARSESGRKLHKKVYGTEPYFFVREDAFDPTTDASTAQYVDRVESGYEAYDGTPVKKIVTHVPKDVGKLSDEYSETYEDDIPFERRCTADYNLSGYVRLPTDESVHVSEIESVRRENVDEPIEPHTLMVDIEVRRPDDFDSEFIENAPNEVTAITAYHSARGSYALFALDPDRQVEPEKIRSFIYENWGGEEETPEHIKDARIDFKRFGEERDLLESFAEYVSQAEPDVMTGWNYIGFDHEYLTNRMRSVRDVNPHQMSDFGGVGGYKTERYITGVPAIDMMSAFCDKLSYGEWESKSLDFVASDVVDVGKIEGDDVDFDENRTKFMAYNVVDVILLEEIDRLRGVVSFWMMIAEVTAIPIYSVGTTMKECEGYLFKMRDDDEILPSTEETDLDGIDGGLVMPPHDGIEEWVGVFDLKSLYPSSMITCNISKETMTYDPDEADIVVPDMPLNYEEVQGDKITEEDISWELGEGACVGFDMSKQGIVPKYLQSLFRNRARFKSLRDQHEPESDDYKRFNQQQRAVKVVMNSFFGVSDHPYFRLSADGLGGAITSVSRYVSWAGVQVIEEQGYDVIYGDTDSLFASMEQNESLNASSVDGYVDAMLELESEINEGIGFIADEIGLPEQNPFVDDLDHGTERHAWVYEAEKLFRRFVQTGSKKRYAGLAKWKEGKTVDDVSVTGYEMVRADKSVVTEEVQEHFIDLILRDAEFDELTEFIQREIEKLERDERPVKEYGIPSSLSKPPEEYPNRPVKRATMFSNKHLGYSWGGGDNPWLVYVDRTPPKLPNVDVIALPWSAQELPEGFEIDVTEHTNKMIRDPIETFLGTIDLEWSEVKTGQKQQTLFTDEDTGGTPVFGDNETEDPFSNVK